MHALTVLNDPDASAQQLATAVQGDPALAVRILRLANSAYFGTPGTIGSVERAVVTLGRDVVQPVVVLAAANVFGDHPNDLPDGFWQHSAAVAAGASVAADLSAVPTRAAARTASPAPRGSKAIVIPIDRKSVV